MKKVFIVVLIIILITGGIVLLFWSDIVNFYSDLSIELPPIEKGVTGFFTERIEKSVSLPPPLKIEEGSAEAFLSKEGVIKWTNIQREKYGLPPLVENFRLNVSAEAKTQDMFENQYFAHSSPFGIEMSDLIEDVDYEFIAIGENLALGNFENDEALVQGWMDSPGHRENILSATYQEIGISVRQGLFEGQSIWIAVQHFGTPINACPQIDEFLEFDIETNKIKTDQLKDQLIYLQAEIQRMRPKIGSVYKQKVEQYNSLVDEYNALVSETKALIIDYNSQVKLFNECLSGI